MIADIAAFCVVFSFGFVCGGAWCQTGEADEEQDRREHALEAFRVRTLRLVKR